MDLNKIAEIEPYSSFQEAFAALSAFPKPAIDDAHGSLPQIVFCTKPIGAEDNPEKAVSEVGILKKAIKTFGGDVNEPHIFGFQGKTYMGIYVYPEKHIVRNMLSSGVSINGVSQKGDLMPMYKRIRGGNIELCKYYKTHLAQASGGAKSNHNFA